MAKKLSKAASEALAKTDWKALDAMTDSDIARQIASNRDAARTWRRNSTCARSGVRQG